MSGSWAVAVAGVAACLSGSVAVAAPAPEPLWAGAQWEYAELLYRHTPAWVGGGRGGAGVRRRGPAKTTVTWSTAGGEVEADGWEHLAKKLKAPAGRKGATETQHRLRVLNRLGADGWEVFSHQSRASSGVTEVWAFKRKLR